MRLKIAQVGERVLRVQARQLTHEEILSDEIQRLIRDMRETMGGRSGCRARGATGGYRAATGRD
jgi:peptide deformylase